MWRSKPSSKKEKHFFFFSPFFLAAPCVAWELPWPGIKPCPCSGSSQSQLLDCQEVQKHSFKIRKRSCITFCSRQAMFCLIFKLSEASLFLSHAKKEKHIRFKNISKRNDLNTYKILDTTVSPLLSLYYTLGLPGYFYNLTIVANVSINYFFLTFLRDY